MASTAQPPERQFPTFNRGELRDQMLEDFALDLRDLISPDTNEPFTDDEIAMAVARGGKYWAEANALDLVLQVTQQQGLYLADQVRIDRAGTSWLEGYHGELWGEPRLLAEGGSGDVLWTATAGTKWLGSTTIPDQNAHSMVDAAGLRYQVLYSAVTDSFGNVTLTLVAVDTGVQTNLAAGTKLTLASGPVTAAQQGVVLDDFTGGQPEESDADYAKRLASAIRTKPASGNSAHQRVWARKASSAVEDAFVYPCAKRAGSVIVCVTQKRSGTKGPLGRVPSVGTLLKVTKYLTPPASPVNPSPPHMLVVGPTPIGSDLVLSLNMPRGRSSGWTDIDPWPGQVGGTAATITAVADQQHVTVTSLVLLPAGVSAPSLMVWDDDTSRFEALQVTSVTPSGGNTYAVVLAAPPEKVLAVGDVVSPATKRLDLISKTIEDYFDSVGPGELVNLATDMRAHRAYRYPEPSNEYPQRIGAGVTAWLQDQLGAALADTALAAASVTTPPLPSDPSDGPRLIVAGKVGIYPF